jgi:hypothetical protein
MMTYMSEGMYDFYSVVLSSSLFPWFPSKVFTFNIPGDPTSFPRSTIFELYIFVLLDPFFCFCL